jgi:hypothetical protein
MRMPMNDTVLMFAALCLQQVRFGGFQGTSLMRTALTPAHQLKYDLKGTPAQDFIIRFSHIFGIK